MDDVAFAVISRTGPVTAMQLQKLVYFCQAWHLATNDDILFDDPIQAWSNGPVIRALFARHRGLRRIVAWQGDESQLSANEVATVDRVVSAYGGLSPEELSELTHRELPWQWARGGLAATAASTAVIEPDWLRVYYGRQVASSEDSLVLAEANVALEGMFVDVELSGLVRAVAMGELSVDAALAHRRR